MTFQPETLEVYQGLWELLL